jgi:hypothetical protein
VDQICFVFAEDLVCRPKCRPSLELIMHHDISWFALELFARCIRLCSCQVCAPKHAMKLKAFSLIKTADVKAILKRSRCSSSVPGEVSVADLLSRSVPCCTDSAWSCHWEGCMVQCAKRGRGCGGSKLLSYICTCRFLSDCIGTSVRTKATHLHETTPTLLRPTVNIIKLHGHWTCYLGLR